MLRKTGLPRLSICLAGLSLGLVPGAFAQAPALITQAIDESKLVTLGGNVRPEANTANDQGRVPDSMPIEHMLLQLQRSPQLEQEATALVDQLHNPSSPNYHRWLTSAQFGEKFGLAQQDLNTIRNWLQSHGFNVNAVYPSGMLIDFSGNAGQVRTAFHTEIHNLNVGGAPHIANMTNPQIPAALAPAVAGIVSLHNFWPHPMNRKKSNYTIGNGYYLVGPGDLAVIYNIQPLLGQKLAGQGQTIVVVEDTDLYSTADWTTFRSTFGLSSYASGTLKTVHPPSTGTNNCTDPGVNGDDSEAAIDVEYASAAAPAANIQLASCSDTQTTFGGLIAVANLVNAGSPPAIVSMSYGECEALNGASANAAFSSTFQQAVAEGVSVFVSAGDDAAAGCDRNAEDAIHGIGITGWGGTPYNVAVGGTDFGDSYLGENSTYWSATNSPVYESALSYIPEIPWNDTCASMLIANTVGYVTTYGVNGFCNSAFGQEAFLGTTGGSGGPSGCATGTPSVFGAVSGTCKGYPKPSWQTGVVGIPNDSVRDIPDVSLFAANGVWGHYYPVCYSDPSFGGVPCTGAPDNWPGFGGTSVSSPIMAGIQALVNQRNGSPQGNPNYAYYALAAKQYAGSGLTNCNSSKGNATASTCAFYDITLGDIDVPCTLGIGDCYRPGGVFGVLSTTNSSYSPAYRTGTGWDFATGIGSVNARNLVFGWKLVMP